MGQHAVKQTCEGVLVIDLCGDRLAQGQWPESRLAWGRTCVGQWPESRLAWGQTCVGTDLRKEQT